MRSDTPPHWFGPEDCSLDAFRAVCEQVPDAALTPNAATIDAGVPVYAGERIAELAADPSGRRTLLREWAELLGGGSGVLIVKRCLSRDLVDEVSAAFFELLAAEREAGLGDGDHFSARGANSRIWNAHEKLAARSPELYARYYANPALALAALAWLGPAYQVTAQVNVVHPGGAAQTPHCDYHLGFLPAGALGDYPPHAHRLSPALTLQGAIAHCDMPIDSGPTLLLPYSQQYPLGYIAANLAPFRDYFLRRAVQAPLEQGDALFFNPALFHAAGENRTDKLDRIANLFQIGSAFGRSIEYVNRDSLCLAVYPTLLDDKISGDALEYVIAATAEGYPFPTNLDLDLPSDGLAPASQQQLLRTALCERWPLPRFAAALDKARRRRSA